MRLFPRMLVLSLVGTVAVGCGAEERVSGDPQGLGSPGGAGPGGTGSVGGAAGPGGTGGAAPGGAAPGGAAPGGAAPGGAAPGGAGGSGLCDIRTINAYGNAPDMLIVLDRSLSMQLANRWAPSQNAVKTITRDFEGLLNFGLSTFPSDNACGAGQLVVPIAPLNAGPVAAAVDGTMPSGFTPTGPSLQQALQVLGDRNPGLDSIVKAGYVLLVTDGEPSCSGGGIIGGLGGLLGGLAGGGGTGGGAPPIDEDQQNAARDAVRALRAANIPTYVIGYQIDPAFQPLMNELAELGGTMMFRPAENADQIVQTFREITRDVVSCSFELSEVPPDPTFVRVEIDDQTVSFDAADGWVLNGTTVTLQGGSCSTLKDGRPHTLNAQVECNPVVLN